MKKLFALALFVCLNGQADTAATAYNKSGGLLVLTDVPCKKNAGFHVYSTAQSTSTQFGCWWSDDLMVHVEWNDGDVRSYPFNIFTLNLEVLKRMKPKKIPGVDI